MAMTAQVKAELATVKVTKPCCRKAELATGAAARRLRTDIADVFGHSSDLVVVNGNGLRRGTRYVVRVVKDGDALARQTGLVDSRGRPARGLPAQVVSGGTCDRVVVRDGDAIAALLTHLGAHDSLMAWEERRMRREVRASANRLANFDDANLRRSARAAVAAGARVERALEILGEDVPEHLRVAGNLRVEHQQASLEELGQLHTPQLTKDAVAGRIRRLLATADKRAVELGIPNTEASLTSDMLDD